jgi:hypothetical protein
MSVYKSWFVETVWVNVSFSKSTFFVFSANAFYLCISLCVPLKSIILIQKCLPFLQKVHNLRFQHKVITIPSCDPEYKLCWLTHFVLQLLTSYPDLFVFSCESVSPFCCAVSLLFDVVSLMRYGCWTRFICFLLYSVIVCPCLSSHVYTTNHGSHVNNPI